ncbi:2Fe-2S iron-sulfur cluster-binding protein [Candidatus Pseudothioglobus singularis]|nr:2Fe-2S iron-sulfur cluster-binding protein [Candidatus Pseudothioglobus singularis]
MSEIEIEIDGQLLSANQGDSIITVADREGIEVPRFCYHKKVVSCGKL